MRAEVQAFITRERLLSQRQPVWVAVSGGVDSMVLLHVLRDLGHPCSVAHVDHGLRGADSDTDRAFVEAYCREHGMECRVRRVDPQAQVEAHGGSVQMAARALRYAWAHELMAEGPHTMALGHHADDAVETLLLYLMRGTGVHGWATIPTSANGFVRPLLGIDRAAITAYAREQGIPFREDASNADPKYLRNRVRNEVLPLLEELRPGARRTMARSVDVLRELEQLATERMQVLLQDLHPAADGTTSLPFHVLEACGTPLLLLRTWLAGTGIHPDTIDDLWQAVAQRRTGAHILGAGMRVTVDRTALILDHPPADLPEHALRKDVAGAAGPFQWRFDAPVPDRIERGAHVAWFDADRLHFPLTLRPWRQGDRMRPLGLGGSKRVSDLLIDAKVPLPQKARTYVLVSGEEIVWLSGLRVAEGVTAGKGTAHVLRIAWEG